MTTLNSDKARYDLLLNRSIQAELELSIKLIMNDQELDNKKKQARINAVLPNEAIAISDESFNQFNKEYHSATILGKFNRAAEFITAFILKAVPTLALGITGAAIDLVGSSIKALGNTIDPTNRISPFKDIGRNDQQPLGVISIVGKVMSEIGIGLARVATTIDSSPDISSPTKRLLARSKKTAGTKREKH